MPISFKWKLSCQLSKLEIFMMLQVVIVLLVALACVIHAQARVPEVVLAVLAVAVVVDVMVVVLAVLAVAVVVDVMVVVLGVMEVVLQPAQAVLDAETCVLVRVQELVPEVVTGVLDAGLVVAIVVVVVLEVVLEAA